MNLHKSIRRDQRGQDWLSSRWLALALWLSSAPALRAANGSWAVDASGNWNTNANWAGGVVADGVGSTAWFTNLLTSSCVVSNTSTRLLGNLNFGCTTGLGWTVNGGSALTLTNPAAAPVITCWPVSGSSSSCRISTPLGGSQGLVKKGTGIVWLNANNSALSGPLIIAEGRVYNQNASGLGSMSVVVSNGCYLDFWVGGIFNQNFVLNGIGAAQEGSARSVLQADSVTSGAGGSFTINGTITLNATSDIGGSSPDQVMNLNGRVTGSGGLVKNGFSNGGGTLVLAGTNTYTGSTTLLRGTVRVAAPETPNVSGPLGQQPTNAVGTILLKGATLQYSSSNQFDYSGRFSTAPNQYYTVDTTNQSVIWSAPLASPGGVLTKGGVGTLTLANPNNSFSGGTTVNLGKLRALANGTLGSGDVAVADGAILEMNAAATLSANANLSLTGGSPAVQLNFTGTQAIHSLSFDGGITLAAAGIWGAVGSGATYTDSRLTGSGRLNVASAADDLPIYASWCMVWIKSSESWWVPNGYDGATDFLGSFGSINWDDDTYVSSSLVSMKAAGINAIICDLTNGWGWLNSIVQSIQRLALGKRMKVCVAVGNIPDVATFESRCGDIWNLFAGPSAPYASTHLFKDGKPVIVCYSVQSAYNSYVASTGTNRQHFTLVWGAGGSATDSWGWQLDPANGAAPSTNAVFVTPSVKYAPSSVSVDLWRKSQAWLDYNFKVAKDSQPAFTIISSFDDIHERNGWLPADTTGAIPGMQMRDMTGAINTTNYYNRVREWILGTPSAVPGGSLVDGCYVVTNRFSARSLYMPNTDGTNLAYVGMKLVQSTPSNTNLNNFFSFYHLGSNVYRITPLNSALFLEVTNNNSGLQVQQDWNSTDPAQRWTLLPVTNGFYSIQNQASGKVLDVSSTATNTPVVQNPLTNGSLSQQWSFGLVARIGPPKPAPSVPAGLTATPGYAQVALAWQASTGVVANYNIKRATVSGGSYTLLATTAATAYTHQTALGGTNYYYVVSAVGNDTESTNSLEVSATPLISATQYLGPLGDTYVRDGTYTNSNFGTATDLYVKLGGNNFDREDFLRFNVSGLANAQAVQLQLMCVGTDTSGSSTTLAFEFVADDVWSETNVTWLTKPAGSGLIFTNLSGCTAGQPVKVDITRQARLEAAGDGLLSLRIAATTTGQYSGVDFGSRENAIPGNRPTLAFVLSAPPPPPVLSVLLQGNTVQVSWPAGYPTYVLQRLTGPLNSSSNAWLNVSGLVSNSYSEPLTNTTSFFRLKAP